MLLPQPFLANAVMLVHVSGVDMIYVQSFTYGLDWMNELQHLPEKDYGQIFVTLNPPYEPDPKSVSARFEYDHPVIDTRVRGPA